MQSRIERQATISPAAEPEWLSREVPTWRGFDPGEHPAIAELHDIAGRLVEIIGPMFWAALIALFLWAEAAPLGDRSACQSGAAGDSVTCSAPAAPAAVAGGSRPRVR